MATRKSAVKKRTTSTLTRGKKSPPQIYSPINPSPNKLRNTSTPYSFLDIKHPIYRKWEARWLTNQRRMAGFDNVKMELDPFEWEIERGPESHYGRRQENAIYLNLPDILATAVTGHLTRFAPKPNAGIDFAELGPVRFKRDFNKPTQAEQVWYNVDGPDNVGNEWTNWWMDVFKMAMNMGHQWIYIESPSEDAGNKEREQQGFRPWACAYDPLDVWNWGFDPQKRLIYAVVRFIDWEPTGDANSLVENQTTSTQYMHYLLMTVEGVTKFGPEFAKGGWWKFTPDKRLYDQGTWEDTDGQIPMFPLYWQESRGTRDMPAMSQPCLTELGNAAVQLMNVGSAAGFQAVDGGKGLEWLAGVDEEGMELAQGQINRGDRYIALPANQDTDQTPHVYPSGQGKTSENFTSREKAIIIMAQALGVSEIIGTSNTSSDQGTGVAQAAAFTASQVPRIVRAAQNLMVGQNKALYFFGKRYGHQNPTGTVQWATKIELIELVERIRAFFEIERLAGIRSETIDAKAMATVAEDKGLIGSDEERKKVLAEFEESAARRTEAEVQAMSEIDAPGQSRQGSLNGPMKGDKQAGRQKAQRAGKKQDKPGPKQNVGTQSRASAA